MREVGAFEATHKLGRLWCKMAGPDRLCWV
jgi:hypothetical protein